MYIKNLAAQHGAPESLILTAPIPPSRVNACEHEVDDLKWLRLKSSVSSLYTTYLQDVDKCYAQADQIFQDKARKSSGLTDLPYKYKPNGEILYFQQWDRALLPSSFEDSSRVMWELVLWPHRQIAREVYHDVSDPENTVALQFRVQKTSADGKVRAIMKHLVCRRFVESDRVVIVWRIFSEGEGDFSGLDVDETGWCSIRPVRDDPQYNTLMEFHSRQVPVPYLTANANNSIGKEFLDMMQNVVEEDRQETAQLMGKHLLATSELA
eukprot:jgi/Phyca11/125723/e_gw1.59.245.1